MAFPDPLHKQGTPTMSAAKQIKATLRAKRGKGAAAAVRRAGMTPAVIYGAGKPPVAISLDYNETKRLIFAGHFKTTVFEIDVEGTLERAIPRDYQLDPVKDFPVHVDFLRISAGQTVKVMVPIHVSDQDVSPGLKAGGALQLVEHAIEVTASPDAIPDSIDISVAALQIGDTIHLSDLALPDGVIALAKPETTILTIVPPTVAEEPEPAAEPAKA